MSIDLVALKKKIDALSPSARLHLAAELIEAGKLSIAETIAQQVADELAMLRITAKHKAEKEGRES